jgi:hypothetical protein
VTRRAVAKLASATTRVRCSARDRACACRSVTVAVTRTAAAVRAAAAPSPRRSRLVTGTRGVLAGGQHGVQCSQTLGLVPGGESVEGLLHPAETRPEIADVRALGGLDRHGPGQIRLDRPQLRGVPVQQRGVDPDLTVERRASLGSPGPGPGRPGWLHTGAGPGPRRRVPRHARCSPAARCPPRSRALRQTRRTKAAPPPTPAGVSPIGPKHRLRHSRRYPSRCPLRLRHHPSTCRRPRCSTHSLGWSPPTGAPIVARSL